MQLNDHGLSFTLPARTMPLWQLLPIITSPVLEQFDNNLPHIEASVISCVVFDEDEENGLYHVTFELYVEGALWNVTALAPNTADNMRRCIMLHVSYGENIDMYNMPILARRVHTMLRVLQPLLLSAITSSADSLPY